MDLNQVIEETIVLTQPQLKAKEVVLQTKLAPDFPRVLADRVQLQQVLLNLVVNALDSLSAVADRARRVNSKRVSGHFLNGRRSRRHPHHLAAGGGGGSASIA